MTELNVAVKADFSGENRKTEAIRKLPSAFLKNANDWASRTVLRIKESYKGGNVFMRPPKEIDQRLGMKVTRLGRGEAVIVIGTGTQIGRDEVVYARIQEEGGQVKAKRGAFLTIPLPGVKGTASQYPNAFLARTAGGQYLLAEPKGKTGIRVLFLLKRSVRLPARRWFSTPIKDMRPMLDSMMSPEGVMATAEKMARAYLDSRKHKRGPVAEG